MTHDEIKRSVSAYYDGELSPEETGEVSAHLAGCAECAKALAELKALSGGIKAAPPAPPAALQARVLAAARAGEKKRSRAPVALAAVFAAVILALMALVMAKRLAPAMFAQIQGMLNAAASTLGSSSGNQ